MSRSNTPERRQFSGTYKLKEMYPYPIIFSFLFLPFLSDGQSPIKNYVQASAVQIRTVDPTDADDADLEAIGTAIGDARIVMLGEQDHGDAPAFLAKTRLVKYLHEKKGFNILAFESDFFGLNAGWEQLPKTKEAIDTFLRGNIFGIWTSCDACGELFRYIPTTYQTEQPLTISGFDSQQILLYSHNNLSRQLDSVLRRAGVPLIDLPEYQQEIFPAFDILTKSYSPPADEVAFRKRDNYLLLIKEQLQTKLPENSIWLMVVENLIQSNIQFSVKEKDYWTSTNARDVQMARNLEWLSTVKFPNERIIVWAHNYHIAKYAGHYPEDFLNPAQTMGAVLTGDSAFFQKTYVLGFTSHNGQAGRIGQKTYRVQKPTQNSIEKWFDPAWEYAFVDFKNYNAGRADDVESFSLKGSIKGKHLNHTAKWTRIFDGVFYIKSMYPCKQLSSK